MDLFDIVAKITLNTSEYESGLKDAEGTGSSFAQKLKSGLGTAAKLGGAAIAAVGAGAVALGKKFVDGAKQTAEYGDRIDKMSQKLGLSKKAYQEWDYVLGQSGADISSMSVGLKTLTNKIDDAKKGGAEAQKMFSALGISLQDLKSMSREDIFAATITGFQNMADSTERAALANDLFGRSGQELIPLFNTSVEETNKLKQAANDLGFVMSDEAVSAAADFNDALDTLQRTIGGLKNGLLSDFLPAITKVMDGLSSIFGGKEGGIKEIGKGISELINKLSENVPQIVEVGFKIVEQLAMSINDNLPMLFEKASDIIFNVIIPGIMDNLPALIETGFSIIAGLVSSIGQALPELIPAAVEMIITIVTGLLDNIDMLIDAAIELVMGLIDGIMSAIPLLLEKAPLIIEKLVSALIRNLPKLVSMAPKIIASLISGIISALPQLILQGPEIVLSIISGIVSAFSDLVGNGKEIIENIKKGVMEKIEDAKKWGKDMIDNFGKGISEKVQSVINKVKDFAGKIKSFLGFSEPEEGPLSDFHTYAPDMMNLFMKGIEDNKKKLENTVADAFNFKDLISGGSIDSKISYSRADSIPELSRPIYLVLDSGELVGKTVNKYDEALGTENVLKLRFGGAPA